MSHSRNLRGRLFNRSLCFVTNVAMLLLLSAAAFGQSVTIEIESEDPIVVIAPSPMFAGSSSAPAGSKVVVQIDGLESETVVDPMNRWQVSWPHELATGSYEMVVTVTTEDGRSASQRRDIRVDLPGELPRRPLLPPPPAETLPEIVPNLDEFQATTDRWRIVPPAYELDEKSRGWWDPYNQNVLKGDFPIIGQNIFLSLTGTSDTLLEGRSVPTPSGPSAERAGATEFFGEGDQGFFNQNIILTADLFEGQTVFKPATWRARATIALNFNHLEVRERGAVNPDVRRGTDRSDGQFGLQELFYERKLADLSP
ncbi:MAG TPA: Ig-like domain-containing protein, partial [Thermoanaerobaculia bacterium]|nr:Ig-like domain-containing protein [Thermoanaerobaculia bacterium]